LKNDSSLLFGRNLDWVSEGGIIVVNKRGIEKKALISPLKNLLNGFQNMVVLLLINSEKSFLLEE